MAGTKKAIILGNSSAYLPGVKAAVTVSNSRNFIAEPDVKPTPFSKEGKKYRGIVSWGENNDLPTQIMDECSKSPIVTAGLPFNISILYGDGIVYGRWEDRKGKKVFRQATGIDEIDTFFDDNDINHYFLEQANDIAWFYNCFPEILLSKDKKIVELRHKEAAFSRWEEMNPESGLIENHFYSAKWGKSPQDKDIDVTPVLSPHRTVRDLKIRMGLEPAKNGKKTPNPQSFRFIIPINMPTPGRNYYQKPYWYSIIESGWLDYAKMIPEFKRALLQNQMSIKYHVELSDDYFEKIFKAEGLSEPNEKQARIKKEYKDLNDFLKGVKNTGKSVISFVRYDVNGKELRRMKINVIDKEKQGGEYIQDSEEVSNIISYGLGVHPSLIGSSPGKNKSINGTEARELFIIKQAMVKPIRDRLLRPLYIIKKFNNWPQDIHFTIPNIVLTTLDQGTGSEKVIS